MAVVRNFNLLVVLLALGTVVAAVWAAPYDVITDDGLLAYEENTPLEKRPFCNAFAGCGRKRALLNQPLSDVSAPSEMIFNKLPRILNSDSKAWEKLFARLQQRQRLYNMDSINN